MENRYRVPKGTKFYRVKVKPIKSKMCPLKDKELNQRLSLSGALEKFQNQKLENATTSTKPFVLDYDVSASQTEIPDDMDTSLQYSLDHSLGDDLEPKLTNL